MSGRSKAYELGTMDSATLVLILQIASIALVAVTVVAIALDRK
jgi:hypothetical protein